MAPARLVVPIFLGCVLLAGSRAAAQDAASATTIARSIPQAPTAPSVPRRHPFWDSGNLGLFGAVTASRTLDFASTRHFRALGDNEWLLTNRIVDNKPLFAAIEAGGVAASIGVSYLLHRANHHRLERWASVLHIGVTVGGAIHNYSLKAPAALSRSVQHPE